MKYGAFKRGNPHGAGKRLNGMKPEKNEPGLLLNEK